MGAERVRDRDGDIWEEREADCWDLVEYHDGTRPTAGVYSLYRDVSRWDLEADFGPLVPLAPSDVELIAAALDRARMRIESEAHDELLRIIAEEIRKGEA